MAKDGKMILPSIDGPKPGEQVFLKPGEAIVNGVPEVGSSYPTEGYVTREVYAKQLTRKQGRKLTAKCRELMDSGATLEDGKHVTNKSMVVKWLIENHC